MERILFLIEDIMAALLPAIWQGSTILTVRKGNQVVIAGDGQATEGTLILHSHVKNVRRIGNGEVICGFTGKTADAVVLFEKLESIIAHNPRQLPRACVEVARFWRQTSHLSDVNAMMIVVNATHTLVITGAGDVLERHDGIVGVGAGGPYALAAAHALYDLEGFSAQDIVEKALNVAADICVLTNKNIVTDMITIE
jgi:ATP-dependent HslUV protease subunit HslV